MYLLEEVMKKFMKTICKRFEIASEWLSKVCLRIKALLVTVEKEAECVN